MQKSRLEAFSDGVIAIIITIMVLEMKVPRGKNWDALKPLFPVFLSYCMSFLFIGIYWGNHHHLLHTVKKVSSRIMLANLNLLFWLSLVPFATGWMGGNGFAPVTITVYAILLNLCGMAYYLLQDVILKEHRQNEAIKNVIQKQKRKGILSLALYSSAIPLSWVHPAISGALFILVSVMWLIPDKNIERVLNEN
jgi:uncharacterized membrane protein